jgi:putative GTP pyrophosphokinase
LLTSGKKHAYYSLISLDLDNRRVEVWSFNKNNLDKATDMYEQLEQRHGRYDQVLVSVSSLISLKEAYPNYFLDIRDFTERVSIIIAEISIAEL